MYPGVSSFLRVMGIKVTDGRDFRPEDDLKDTGCYIFNEKAREMYDLELGIRLTVARLLVLCLISSLLLSATKFHQ